MMLRERSWKNQSVTKYQSNLPLLFALLRGQQYQRLSATMVDVG